MPRINPYTRLKETFDKYKSKITRERIAMGIIALALLIVNITTCTSKNKEIAQITQQAEYWKDKHGNAHVTIQKLEVDKATMKKEVDSIARVLEIKPKTIIQYVKTTARIDTVIKPIYTPVPVYDTVWTSDTTYNIDTTRGYDLDYRDSSFLSIQGRVPSRSGLRVQVQADLTVTEFWDRTWFLGRRRHYIDIGTNNPYITFSNARQLSLKEKPKLRVRPGVGIGFNYDPMSKQLSPGIQVGIYVFKSK